MKANESDYQKYSDAIDRIQEGNDAMIELFNELEDDHTVVFFDDDVLELIEKAKIKYGAHSVSKKINNVTKEMLSWLDLGDVDLEEDDEKKS